MPAPELPAGGQLAGQQGGAPNSGQPAPEALQFLEAAANSRSSWPAKRLAKRARSAASAAAAAPAAAAAAAQGAAGGQGAGQAPGVLVWLRQVGRRQLLQAVAERLISAAGI